MIWLHAYILFYKVSRISSKYMQTYVSEMCVSILFLSSTKDFHCGCTSHSDVTVVNYTKSVIPTI